MLVTNCVILPFWVGDILARETRHLEQLLANVSPSTAQENQGSLPPALQTLLAEAPEGCIFWNGAYYSGRHQETDCQQGVQSLAAVAAKTGTTQRSLSTLIDLVSSRFLYVAVPVAYAESSSGVAAAGISLSRLLHPLWTKEQVVAAYLVFNAFILAALAFFRLLKSYVQPVDRMVQAAENYRSDGLHAFLAEKPANELGQLAGSIQAMVQRIETDKEKLTSAVEELAEKNSLLQANQREMVRTEKLASVGRLAAGLAHEIGNPLGVAQGYLQLLSMDDCREEERAEYTAKALRELERVDGLIRRLLDYARAGQGEPVRFDLHYLLGEIVGDLKVQPFLRGIRLDLVRQAAASDVCADREQLRQVILNCVLNAVDAVKAGRHHDSGTIQIVTALSDAPGNERNMLRISITDNGVGIPDELLDTVFDPFFTTKELGAGTGLGLSVSLGLVESMGGRMEIQSRAGEGTTVFILLPLAMEDAFEAIDYPGETRGSMAGRCDT